MSIAVYAIHTAETRYSVEQTTIEQRDILQTQNRYGLPYVKPLGGFGSKGASRGSFGFKGNEQGASNLATNAFILRGRDPSKISNAYASARGYQIINEYVKLDPVKFAVTARPQITGSPEGHARVISKKDKGLYLPIGTVVLRTRDLPALAPEEVYEAWLVDEDTGTSFSIGIFQPSNIGRVALLKYEAIMPLNPFESLMVSIEPYPDEDPRPSGEIVLSGIIGTKSVRAR